jgi:hypothetical protein
MYVTLAIDGAYYTRSIHALVALAFVGPRPRRHEVNHIDGDRFNNRASNLEYTTRAGNMRHAAEIGRLRCKTSADSVRAIREAARLGETHVVIARRFGLSRPQTTKIIARLFWRHVP